MTPDQITEARALVERLKGYTPHSGFSNLEAMAKTALRAAAALTAALDRIEALGIAQEDRTDDQ